MAYEAPAPGPPFRPISPMAIHGPSPWALCYEFDKAMLEELLWALSVVGG